jgi:trimeric autotransporter adhesin
MVKLRPNLLLLLLAIAFQNGFSQSEQHRPQAIVTDYSVSKITYSNGYALLQGSFSRAGNYSGSAIALDQALGAEDLSWPVISGDLEVIVPDGNGGFYAGGNFYGVDNEDVGNLVHILPNKTLDRSWLPSATGHIYTMVLQDGILYVGGSFVSIAGQSRYYAAAFNTSTGSLTSWNPHFDNRVTEIEVTDNAVFAAGLFSKVNNGAVTRSRIAAVDKVNGTAIAGWDISVGGSSASVEAMAASADALFIGGTFTSVNGTARNGIAAVSLTTGTLNETWNPQPEMISGTPEIMTLVLSGTTLYVGGSFNGGLAGDASVTHLGAVTATGAGTIINTFKPVFDTYDQVREMTLDGNTLYIYGGFGEISGVNRFGLAALNTSNATPTEWSPTFFGNRIATLAVSDSKIFIGGEAQGVNWGIYDSHILIDESTGTFWPHSLDVGSGEIETMVVQDNTLFIGGRFTTVNAVNRKNIAAIDLSTGNVLPWNPGAEGFISTFDNTRVSAMDINGNTLYISGIFRTVAGQTRLGLAAVDATSGALSAWNPGIGDGTSMGEYAVSMDIHDNALYLAGTFTTLAGQNRPFLGAVDLNSGDLLSWDPEVISEISKIRIAGNSAYVLGDFEDGIAGAIREHGIAAIDLTTALTTEWNPDFNSTAIADFALTDTDIYVASYYDVVNGEERPGLASFSLATGELNPWHPDLGSALEGNWDVQTVAASPTRLYVGGGFIWMGREYRSNYTEYDLVDLCTADASIELQGSTLTALPGFSYQWFENNLPVGGATAQTFDINIFEYGKYAVEVSINGCTVRSDDYIYLVTAPEEEIVANHNVYPNPVKDELVIEVSENAEVQIYDIAGSPVRQSTLVAGGTAVVNTSGWTHGVYIVNIKSLHSRQTVKVFKTN